MNRSKVKREFENIIGLELTDAEFDVILELFNLQEDMKNNDEVRSKAS